MAEEINVRVKHKGMTLAEWKLSPVILLERELGVATDTGEVRVGNGKDKWSTLPIIKGEKGEPLKVESTTKNSRGDTVIKFDDGSSATISKGDKGDSITVESHKKDSQGNTVISFSDGSKVTVDKGDSIKVTSTSNDEHGNTVVEFSDGGKVTISKGDKGDPLKFEDLTQEQINQIKVQDVDLSNYATKDDLAKVDVSGQLEGYAKKDHTHTITDVDGLQDELKNKASSDDMITNIGVDKNGVITFYKNGSWYTISKGSSYWKNLAFQNHTHPEYLKKGDPIELTPEQKAELKGERGAPGARGASGTSVSIQSTTQDSSKRVTTVVFSNGTTIDVPWGKDGTDGATGARGQQGLAGQPGKGVVNIRTGMELKYWVGSKSEYEALSTKDPKTIYDVYEE